MITLAHISDLHFGREQERVINSLLNQLNVCQPDLVIISGDLTQRAKHGEFVRANKFLDDLGFPYLVIPGNHDMSAHNLLERFCYPWRKWRTYISEDLESTYAHSEFIAVGLNSARRLGFYFDWSRGRINQTQIIKAIDQLSVSVEGALKIVVAHHPFWLPGSSLKRRLIGGRDDAIHSFSRAGVDLILGGHIHLPYMSILEGVLISHAGTAVSNRLSHGQANSFNIIKGNRNKLNIATWEWNQDDFYLRQTINFEKQEKGWTTCL